MEKRLANQLLIFLFVFTFLSSRTANAQTAPDSILTGITWNDGPQFVAYPGNVIVSNTPSPVQVSNEARAVVASGSKITLKSGFHAGGFNDLGYFNAKVSSQFIGDGTTYSTINYPLFKCENCNTGKGKEHDFMKKYWEYRDRFRRYFTKIGPNQGEGLQLTSIFYGPLVNTNDPGKSICNNDWRDINCHDVATQTGEYIGVLSSEYKLLKESGQDVTGTLNELYYVINAIERLDYTAESFLGGTNSYNGFFLRDDVWGNFNQNWKSKYQPGGNERNNINCVKSDFYHEGNPNKYRDNEASQDQLIGILLGFAQVKKFVDPDAEVNGIKLVSWVQALTKKMVDYVANTYVSGQSLQRASCIFAGPAACLFCPNGGWLDYAGNWVMANPVSGNLVTRGPMVQSLSYAIASTAQYICPTQSWMDKDVDAKLTFHYDQFLCPDIRITHKILSLDDIGELWEKTSNYAFPKININTCEMGDVMSSTWPFCIDIDINTNNTVGNYNMALSLAATQSSSNTHTWSHAEIARIASDATMEIFDLVYSTLHNTQPQLPYNFQWPTRQARYQNILESAPCSGSYNYLLWDPSNPKSTTPPWDDYSRWNRIRNGKDYSGGIGDHNGLDYMWLYNLYRIAYTPLCSADYFPKYENNACSCSGSEAIKFALNSTSLNQTVTLENQFSQYATNYSIHLPEYISDDVTIADNQKIGTLKIIGEVSVCNSHISIDHGGTLIVGDALNTGILRIKAGSYLQLWSNFSHVIINEGSSIIVEEGAHFNIANSPDIVLAGPNAFFDVIGASFVDLGPSTAYPFRISKGTASVGGTMRIDKGSFYFNNSNGVGSTIKVTDCGLILGPNLNLYGMNNSIFILEGSYSLIDVMNLATTIDINNNDVIHLDRGTASSGGIMRFEGGNFNIHTGGTLINTGCTLQFYSPVTINYYEDAEIQLLEDAANLDIQGTLNIGNDATFGFTYPGYNSGFIRFSNPLWGHNITCGTNSSFVLSGAGKNDKILEVTQEGLYDPTLNGVGLLHKFWIVSGRAEFAKDSRLSISGACRFVNANFTESAFNKFWGGIELFGQPNVFISNIDVDHAIRGVTARLSILGNRLNISNSTFTWCGSGIEKYGKGISLTDNEFSHCDAAYYSLGGDNEDFLNGNYMHENGGGIAYDLTTPAAPCNLTKNTLTYNTYYPFFSKGAIVVNARCNTISHNEALPAFYLEGGSLNLSSLRNAGYNDLSRNDFMMTISMDGGLGLDLDMGYNLLYVDDYNGAYPCTTSSYSTACKDIFYGYYPGDYGRNSLTLHYNMPIGTLNANYNQWSPTSSTPFNGDKANFAILSDAPGYNYGSMYVVDAAPINGLPTCGAYDGNPCTGLPVDCYESPLLDCHDCEAISFPGTSMDLKDAVKLGMSYLDTSVARYADALDLFYKILTHNFSAINEKESYLLKISYDYMSQAYSKAVEEKQIILNSPYVSLPEGGQLMVEVINNKISKAEAEDDYYGRYYGNLELAEAYRIAEMRGTALEVYDGMTFVNDSDQIKVETWKCFIAAEKALIAREITTDQFDSIIQNCSIGGLSARKAQPDAFDSKSIDEKINKYSLLPNPTNGTFTLRIVDGDDSEKSITISDLLGNTLWVANSNFNTEVSLDISIQPSGIYFVKVIQGGKTTVQKIVKM